MEHIHASVIENNRFTQNKCFTGDDDMSVLQEASKWLVAEIEADPDVVNQSKMIAEIEGWDGHSEAIEVESPFLYKGRTITLSYRLMWIDGDCNETI